MDIRIGIVPAAGLGSRFLPFTKSVPKELLPILNKPSIQYIIEEGNKSGINTWGIITNHRKQALRDYLSNNHELEKLLTNGNKHALLDDLNALIEGSVFHYAEQENPRGLGHAISLAHDIVGNNYFGVLLPDDIIAGEDPAIAQLMLVAKEHTATVIAVQEVPREHCSSYGIIAIKEIINDSTFQISNLVEKPKPEDAPSTMAIIGRYILSPRIFECLQKTKAGSGGEIQLTDALDLLARSGDPVIAHVVNGDRFDIGVPRGWVQAVNYYAQLNNLL